MYATILLVTSKSVEVNTTTGYVIGAIVALLIFGYLFYTLIKPEKF
jgi:K+-transporting ATPase KdpF subunit